MRRALPALLAAAALAAPAAAQPASVGHAREAGIKDADTRAWWHFAEQLSSDAMEGRDTGSPGYDRAAAIVAREFKAAGLQPAGDNGSWFQTFPVHEVKVESAGTSFALVRDGAAKPLRFLQQVTVRPTDDMPATLDATLTFRGYCAEPALADARGKVVVCYNTRRTGLTTAAQRIRAAEAAGAVGLIHVDDPYFTIEPPRWPAAYARSVAIAGSPAPAASRLVVMTLSAEAFGELIAGSGRNAEEVLKLGGAKQPLPAFDIPARLQVKLNVSRRDYTAKNVLAVLPGRDPALKAEHLVLSAHLDGYGYGEPVGGDSLYNGALDDAAYVGTLIRFADRHRGKPLRRSVVFAAFAGEEKGLLGATWFTRHPSVPASQIVADVNLDQLRPLFPLDIMTTLAVDDSSLGQTVRQVAGPMNIRIQPDPEPERGLLQRADHWPFMQIGVPATGFIFGYQPGTEAERRYREWYQVRYHRPQDDLTQPMDFAAAAKFNSFFYKLAETVADAPARPSWTPGSPYAPKP
ncbi:MAG: peptidase [Phenylobacterium sp.]|nr:peptidase [Phenylobacterium sp.]